MNVPLVIIVVSLLLGAVSILVRARPHWSAFLAAGGVFVLGLFLLLIPLEQVFSIAGLALKFDSSLVLLGRALVFDETTRGFVGFIYVAVAFFLAGSAYADTNRFYVPLTIIMTLVLALALMLKPFVYAAILLELAAMVGVLILVAPEYPARRTAMRLVFVFTLAMMGILIAGWLLDVVGVTGATPETARWTAALLAIGFSVLMAIPPFHYWLSAAADESNPFVVISFLLLMQTAGLYFLLRFLDTYEWLRTQTAIYTVIRAAGTAMIWFGGLMSLGQKRMARIIVYIMLAEMGVILLAVGLNSEDGYDLALMLSAARIPSAVLWATSLAYLIQSRGDDVTKRLSGAAHSHRLKSSFLLAGMWGAIGLPLSAMFPGRWALLAPLSQGDRFGALTIMLAWVLGGAVILRWFILLWMGEGDGGKEIAWAGRNVVIFICMICILAIGLFPQMLLPWIRQVAVGLPQLLP